MAASQLPTSFAEIMSAPYVSRSYDPYPYWRYQYPYPYRTYNAQLPPGSAAAASTSSIASLSTTLASSRIPRLGSGVAGVEPINDPYHPNPGSSLDGLAAAAAALACIEPPKQLTLADEYNGVLSYINPGTSRYYAFCRPSSKTPPTFLPSLSKILYNTTMPKDINIIIAPVPPPPRMPSGLGGLKRKRAAKDGVSTCDCGSCTAPRRKIRIRKASERFA
ncbi:hypothetical protein DFJ77DRAFT_459061 [Powellomyces hirtus]|nr:hypothetical protein DFJ77DRAFT_459061 [Powellomyces hirtus]